MSLFAPFSRPFPNIDFGMHFGRPLAHFWHPLGSNWLPFGLLWLLLAPFWHPLALLAPLAPFWHPLAPFWPPFGSLWLPLAPFWLHFIQFGLIFGRFLIIFMTISNKNRVFGDISTKNRVFRIFWEFLYLFGPLTLYPEDFPSKIHRRKTLLSNLSI